MFQIMTYTLTQHKSVLITHLFSNLQHEPDTVDLSTQTLASVSDEFAVLAAKIHFPPHWQNE